MLPVDHAAHRAAPRFVHEHIHRVEVVVREHTTAVLRAAEPCKNAGQLSGQPSEYRLATVAGHIVCTDVLRSQLARDEEVDVRLESVEDLRRSVVSVDRLLGDNLGGAICQASKRSDVLRYI